MKFLLSLLGWLDRLAAHRARRRQQKFLRIPVDSDPDPKTLDALGQERLNTHVRTRPDLY